MRFFGPFRQGIVEEFVINTIKHGESDVRFVNRYRNGVIRVFTEWIDPTHSESVPR